MASREDFLSFLKTNTLDEPFINYFSAEKTGLSISRREFHTLTERCDSLLSKAICGHFEFVGIELNDYLWLPCLLTSIWKLGKACACIGTQYSQECNLNFLNALNVKYVITDNEKPCYVTDLVDTFQIKDRLFSIWKMKSDSVGNVSNKPLDICYGIMTSGSTGLPKIIQVPWSCIMPNVVELIRLFSISGNDNVYLSSPYTFDPFFVELLISLVVPCTLTIVSSQLKMCSETLIEVLFENQEFVHGNHFGVNKDLVCETSKILNSPVTFLQITPSIFKTWSLKKIKEVVLSEKSPLRILMLGGEKFPTDLLKLKSKRNRTQIYNIYGITEISCWAFVSNVTEKSDEISLGRPLNNIVYNVDENNELVLGSRERRCLIDGEKNVDIDEIVYRKTGDLVSIKNSEIYYVGRTNQIVKKFGIKINLEKIEIEFLNVHKHISECICVFDERTTKLALFCKKDGLNEDYHVVSEKGIGLGLRSVELPDFIIEIPRIPLNGNGKCDRIRLLELVREIARKRRGEVLENIFQRVWTTIVGSKNFVHGGGDSVKALQLITGLEEAGIELSKNFLSTLLSDGDYQNCFACVSRAENKKIKLNIDEKIYKFSISWTFDMEKCVDASPAVFVRNGEVDAVVGSHSSRLSSVKVDTGQENWTINLTDRIESGFSVNKSSTFGVIGCYDHRVYCISTSDGKINWEYKTGGMIKSTPCLSSDEETVFVASYDTYLYRLKCHDGALTKRLKLSNRGIFSSGIVSDELKAFFIGTLDGTCISLNQETNEVKWRHQLSNPIFASPVFVDGVSVIFTEVIGRLNCFDGRTGDKIWLYECSGFAYSTPVCQHDFLVFPCYDNHVYCLKLSEKPSIEWKSQLDSPGFGKPCPLLIGDDRSLAVASTKGFLYLIHLETGSNLAQIKLDGEVFSSPKIHLDNLIVGCRDNNVYCMKIERLSNG